MNTTKSFARELIGREQKDRLSSATSALKNDGRSILQGMEDMHLAKRLIELDARMSVLEAETRLHPELLRKLYKEMTGKSPSQGLLPFSADWYMGWRANVQSTIFYSMYQAMSDQNTGNRIDSILLAYKIYCEHEISRMDGGERALSFTRAWMLVRYVSSGVMQMTDCLACHHSYITHANEIKKSFVCPSCKPPVRIAAMLKKQERIARSRMTNGRPPCTDPLVSTVFEKKHTFMENYRDLGATTLKNMIDPNCMDFQYSVTDFK